MGFPSQFEDDHLHGRSSIIVKVANEKNSATVHADKIRLTELIDTLQSELISAKDVMKNQQKEIGALVQELCTYKADYEDLTRRLRKLDKQRLADSITVQYSTFLILKITLNAIVICSLAVKCIRDLC